MRGITQAEDMKTMIAIEARSKRAAARGMGLGKTSGEPNAKCLGHELREYRCDVHRSIGFCQ
jgi:hypothetical protein